MSQQRDLPESMAWRVIGRLESGQTQRSVADAVGVARSVVARLWNRFQETGNVKRRPGAGRPCATTSTDDRYIQLTARRNRTENAIAAAKTVALGNRTKGVQPNNESRFSQECESQRVLVWRDRGTRNNPAFVRERSQYRRAGWMDANARPHRARLVENMLEAETIQRMEWPAFYPDLNPIEHVWDMLGRRIAARPRPPATVRDLRLHF
ncbi:cubilin [Trichonephila clavipes]|uniref:Cubilin n=1 Tax=Trichonephila clavipes TaxID=2585209 RepID=A0A8X6VTV7_TRICX|nr:cubilin [Trichonephila clavipes]